MSDIVLIGLNHKQAPVEVRESLAFADSLRLETLKITAGIRKSGDTGDAAAYQLWTAMAARLLPPLAPGDAAWSVSLAYHSQINTPAEKTVAAVMAVGAVMGGAMGGRLAGKVRPAVLRRIVVTLGVVVALIYWIR